MDNLKKEYKEIIEQRKKIIEELKPLEKSEVVKKYLQLCEQNHDLYNKQLSLYKEIKIMEYESCEHILVYSKIDYDRLEGRTYRSCGCIKCGLDNSVLEEEKRFLSADRKVMDEYLRKNYLSGIETKISCDLELAQAIYSKIKEEHPDIDDETAIQYFENALENIRNTKVSDNRKMNRAKRLSLNPNFKRWNASDIHND